MASKKQEQMLVDNIIQTAKIVKNLVGNDLDRINEQVKTMLDEFAEETKTKIVLGLTAEGELTTSIVDLKSDYVRTRYNTDESMLSLKGKLYGVPMDVKVVKDETSFTNKEVADALAELSRIVEAMPYEMKAHGKDDWAREPGGAPKSVAEKEDELPGVLDEIGGDALATALPVTEELPDDLTGTDLPTVDDAQTAPVDAPATEQTVTPTVTDTANVQQGMPGL